MGARIWVVVVALMVTGCVRQAATPQYQELEGVNPPQATSAAPARPAVAPKGQPAVDGDLSFIVDSVSQAPTIDAPYASWPATGVWIIVDLTVANVGNAPATYAAINQKLIVGTRQFEYSGEPTYALAENMNSTINPGLSIVTRIAYDVPVGSQPASLEVHGAYGPTPGAYAALA